MKDYISRVIRTYLGGRFSERTEKDVRQWLAEGRNEEEKMAALHGYWDSLQAEADGDARRSLAVVKRKLGMEARRENAFLRFRGLRVAAVLAPFLLLAGLSVYYFNAGSDSGQTVKVTVPYGDRRLVDLPDGSEIWVNAGSTIEYPARFDGGTREVKLSGEAYFSVARDEARPFIVRTEKIAVKVLGTKFNVSAYAGAKTTTTTLSSGKVSVETKYGQSYTLEPGRQLTYNNHTSEASLASAPAQEASSWISGNQIFNYQTMEDIIRALERKYNVSIKADPSVTGKEDLLSVKFVNGESLQEALDILKGMAGFSYRMKGDDVVIKANRDEDSTN